MPGATSIPAPQATRGRAIRAEDFRKGDCQFAQTSSATPGGPTRNHSGAAPQFSTGVQQ